MKRTKQKMKGRGNTKCEQIYKIFQKKGGRKQKSPRTENKTIFDEKQTNRVKLFVDFFFFVFFFDVKFFHNIDFQTIKSLSISMNLLFKYKWMPWHYYFLCVCLFVMYVWHTKWLGIFNGKTPVKTKIWFVLQPQFFFFCHISFKSLQCLPSFF